MSQSSSLEILNSVLGIWRGTGQGKFPTIEPFQYAEVHSFSQVAGRPLLSYTQDTFLLGPAGEETEASHFETGLIKVEEDGSLTLSNAQDSMRVEVLRGLIEELEEGFQIVWTSELHGNDPRMVSSKRLYRFDGTTFHYTIDMATQTVPDEQRHLEASLEQVSVSSENLRRRAQALMSDLDGKSRRILSLRFGIDDGKVLSHSTIAEQLDLTKSEVEAIERAALTKISHRYYRGSKD